MQSFSFRFGELFCWENVFYTATPNFQCDKIHNLFVFLLVECVQKLIGPTYLFFKCWLMKSFPVFSLLAALFNVIINFNVECIILIDTDIFKPYIVIFMWSLLLLSCTKKEYRIKSKEGKEISVKNQSFHAFVFSFLCIHACLSVDLYLCVCWF